MSKPKRILSLDKFRQTKKPAEDSTGEIILGDLLSSYSEKFWLA